MEKHTQNKTWDPFGQSNIETTFSEDKNKFVKKLDKYNKNPRLPIRNLLLLAIPGIICLGLFIVLPYFLDPFTDSD